MLIAGLWLRALCCLTDRLGNSGVVLLAFHKWFYIGPWDQLDRVAKPADLTRPIMTAGIGFHCNNTSRLSGKDPKDLIPT